VNEYIEEEKDRVILPPNNDGVYINKAERGYLKEGFEFKEQFSEIDILSRAILYETPDNGVYENEKLGEDVEKWRVSNIRSPLFNPYNLIHREEVSFDLFMGLNVEEMHSVDERVLGRIPLLMNRRKNSMLGTAGKQNVVNLYKQLGSRELSPNMWCPFLDLFNNAVYQTGRVKAYCVCEFANVMVLVYNAIFSPSNAISNRKKVTKKYMKCIKTSPWWNEDRSKLFDSFRSLIQNAVHAASNELSLDCGFSESMSLSNTHPHKTNNVFLFPSAQADAWRLPPNSGDFNPLI
jgi:hypothetical protein